jgi:hypothetical protein
MLQTKETPMRTNKTPDFRENFFRCYVYATRALQRGDYANAEKWSRQAERHIAISRRFEDLAGQQHRPKQKK